MVTCLLNHKEQKTSVVSPILEDSHEVFASLRNGHVVESLALNMHFGEIGVSMVIHATDFALTQVKIKNDFDNINLDDQDSSLSETEKNQEELFLRMSAIEDAEGVINAIYDRFLTIRIKPSDFASELANMSSHIEKRLSQYLSKNRKADESTGILENFV